MFKEKAKKINTNTCFMFFSCSMRRSPNPKIANPFSKMLSISDDSL